MLWVLCELAIAACDLAEVIGSAIGLNLLFGIPITWGIAITALDVLIVLYLQNKGFRLLEALVIVLITTIAGCFMYEIIISKPSWTGIAHGFLPHASIIANRDQLYIAIGILGATVMPHNLYLHSSIVQTRRIAPDVAAKREAIRFATIDSSIALTFAFAINAAILVLAAQAFHLTTNTVASIEEAHRLLAPALGVSIAGVVFALALLASGQSATLTATLGGQIVMEGFLHLQVPPWLRRVATRLIAIVPAVVVTAFYGESATAKLLVPSQVVLSLQLPFAVIPLVHFTNRPETMGAAFVSPLWLKATAVGIATAVTLLNLWLVSEVLF
jgi:manganese transport protein